MRQNDTQIRYFAYCRKSSEDSSEKQVLSLDAQKRELDLKVEREGLFIVKAYQEAKTAKKPGREAFNQMLDDIVAGKANAILCWKLDRLARNPVDSGRIQWLLQTGVIKIIKTYERDYLPTDHSLIASVEMGMATQYSRDLRTMAFRTIRSKIASGWRPGPSPVGYINVFNIDHREIAPDPDRFTMVRQIWDLFLTGSYSVSKIRSIANNKWGFRTKTTRKMGGRPLSMSHIYKVLNDPFYYGHYLYNNPDTGLRELYKGNHQAMITKQEYDRAQTLLGKKGKHQPKTREFAFTGLMHCGECHSSITAEEKNQIICSACKFKFGYEYKTACPKCATDISEMKSPKILKYIYYRCTKKKNGGCTQKFLRLEDLEAQFNKALSDLAIDDEYLHLALDYLRSKQDLDIDGQKDITKSLQATYNTNIIQLENLSREYTSAQNIDHGLYTPEEFKAHKQKLLKERKDIEDQIEESKSKIDQTLELSERTFNFCAYAYHHFNTGDLQKKREIFSNIGSNLTLKDKKLSVQALEPYLLIENELSAQKKLYGEFEPKKNGATKRKTSASRAGIPSWLRD